MSLENINNRVVKLGGVTGSINVLGIYTIYTINHFKCRIKKACKGRNSGR